MRTLFADSVWSNQSWACVCRTLKEIGGGICAKKIVLMRSKKSFFVPLITVGTIMDFSGSHSSMHASYLMRESGLIPPIPSPLLLHTGTTTLLLSRFDTLVLEWCVSIFLPLGLYNTQRELQRKPSRRRSASSSLVEASKTLVQTFALLMYFHAKKPAAVSRLAVKIDNP